MFSNLKALSASNKKSFKFATFKFFLTSLKDNFRIEVTSVYYLPFKSLCFCINIIELNVESLLAEVKEWLIVASKLQSLELSSCSQKY